jgi:mRNA-degrading endonuclease RelE of RelBE toxin-antitoxin system
VNYPVLRISTVSGNDMHITYTHEFRREIKKIRDKAMQTKVKKIVERIIDNPDIGKPLRYELAGLRSVRVPPFRILYELSGDYLIFHTFEHRDTVYS